MENTIILNRKDQFVYVGNWDRHKRPPQNGLSICEYDAQSGELKMHKSVAPEITVGTACLNTKRTVLYCTDEYDTLPGYFLGGGGQVYAFSVNAETADLIELNHQPSYGSMPSCCVVDATGNYLLVTHHTDRFPVTRVVKETDGKFRIVLQYDDATTVLFRLHEDGSIGIPCDVYTHSGDGGPLRRQTHPQLHSVSMSPSGKLFLVCDKGNDEIVIFRINHETDKLEVCNKGFKLDVGSSPRYSVFHPTRPYVFLNHETKAIVSSLQYDEEGAVDVICTVSALPDGVADNPDMKQSDIKIHPSGKYLYSLVRGMSAISVFEIEEETGKIRPTQNVTLDGTGPRGCAISSDGEFMLIAALTSHDVLVWAIGKDGKLSPTGKKLKQQNPGNVTFF